MKVGIVQYPGSNCIEDMRHYFEDRGDSVFYIWHKEDNFENYDGKMSLLVIPGGFAFGDRYYEKATGQYTMDPGLMAVKSPVSKIILAAAKEGVPIFGVCNGFQILIHLGLLPGKLEKNTTDRFECRRVNCYIKSDIAPELNQKRLELDVANSYGNYTWGEKEMGDLENHLNVFLLYAHMSGQDIGSKYNVAGICDDKRQIFGMMPHPERKRYFHCHIYSILEAVVNKRMTKLASSIKRLMLSEHISYKSTRKYLKHLYTEGDHVIQGPGENAGIVDIGDGYCLAIRVESHNHPTFIDPYNGAATGVGGILRDIFTMGARPIAVLDFLRFGTDDNSKRLLDETVRGISDYANCFGVANVGGDCYLDSCYNKNPLVNVAAIGIMKKENIVYGNAKEQDELLIYVGAKTGNDGVGGADMASQTFSSDMDTEDLKANIQIGDPFLEKLLLEACLEIAENKLAVGMQDMGAGGLLCASLEVVQRGRVRNSQNPLFPDNLGCEIYTSKIPTKGELDECDKLISESQERMLIVASESNKDKIFAIFEKWDLEYSVVGRTTNEGYYTVMRESKEDDSMGYSILYCTKIENFSDIREDWDETVKREDLPEFNPKKQFLESWKSYDSTIGSRTLYNGRFEGLNSSIINLPEVGKKIMISWGSTVESAAPMGYNILKINGMTVYSKPLGLVNCLNYGDPADSMGDLSRYVYNLAKQCKRYDIPVLGGNVSLYNATDGKSIHPTPILVGISLIDNNRTIEQ